MVLSGTSSRRPAAPFPWPPITCGSAARRTFPAEGSAILASNHAVDSVFLPMMLDREVVLMGKADYFTGTGLKGWMTSEFMCRRAIHPRGLHRRSRASEAALNAGLKRLRDGELFGI